jgi:gas vesicle protein
MPPNLQNQVAEPSGEQPSDVETDIFANMPSIDDEKLPEDIPETEDDILGDLEDELEAGDNADEPKAVEVLDDAEFKVGDETIKGSDVKQLLELRENYSQQRNRDRQEFDEVVERVSGEFSDRVDQQVKYTREAVIRMRQVAMGGHTTESLIQLSRENPDLAEYFHNLGKQMDGLLDHVADQTSQWYGQTKSAKEQQTVEAVGRRQMEAEISLAKEPWFNEKFINQAKNYLAKNKAEKAGAIIGQNAFLVRALHKAMAYDNAIARQAQGKQAPNVTNSLPSSRPAKRQSDRRQFSEIVSKAKDGDRSARAALFSRMPTA